MIADGKSKASVRTDGSVDAAAVCGQFGGGGSAWGRAFRDFHERRREKGG